MAPSLLFRNPINTQFNILCSAIQYNLALLDLESNTAMVCLHHKKESDKRNGFVVKDCSSNQLYNALKLFTFNSPIVVGLVKQPEENLLLQITQYTKALELMDSTAHLKSFKLIPTFVTKGPKSLAIGMQKEVGLINPKIKYQLQTT
jgi:hypothetical protein